MVSFCPRYPCGQRDKNMKLVEQNFEMRLCGACIHGCSFRTLTHDNSDRSEDYIHAWLDLYTESAHQTFHLMRMTVQGGCFEDSSSMHALYILLTFHQSECTIQVSVLNNLADLVHQQSIQCTERGLLDAVSPGVRFHRGDNATMKRRDANGGSLFLFLNFRSGCRCIGEISRRVPRANQSQTARGVLIYPAALVRTAIR
ncbi:hypothetical protein EDD85DRAFT_834377 [Armillaria nabsnona]|nr:hypothetical protein EDD85DRAFT_834377 [Armillaria nabsnona]